MIDIYRWQKAALVLFTRTKKLFVISDRRTGKTELIKQTILNEHMNYPILYVDVVNESEYRQLIKDVTRMNDNKPITNIKRYKRDGMYMVGQYQRCLYLFDDLTSNSNHLTTVLDDLSHSSNSIDFIVTLSAEFEEPANLYTYIRTYAFAPFDYDVYNNIDYRKLSQIEKGF